MSITTKKRTLFAGFVSIATFIIVASCANDTGTGNTAAQTAAEADSIAKVAADSTAAAKAVIKKKKGKASGMVSMDNTLKMEKDKEGVYSRAEKMPEYPGGETALSKFVENNITYPQDAIDQNTEGTVNVSFVVDEKGKVMNPLVTGKSASHGLDEEAVKVVKQMPAWKPGMVKGKAVKTRLSLPVTFKLADA
jgi:periplasmic protein TonB